MDAAAGGALGRRVQHGRGHDRRGPRAVRTRTRRDRGGRTRTGVARDLLDDMVLRGRDPGRLPGAAAASARGGSRRRGRSTRTARTWRPTASWEPRSRPPSACRSTRPPGYSASCSTTDSSTTMRCSNSLPRKSSRRSRYELASAILSLGGVDHAEEIAFGILSTMKSSPGSGIRA